MKCSYLKIPSIPVFEILHFCSKQYARVVTDENEFRSSF